MTALRTIQRGLTLWIGAAMLTLGLVLLALLGLATVVVPAGLGILAIELTRAKRGLRGWAGCLPRKNKRLGKESTGSPFAVE
jgi:hypothetical protein